MGFTHVILLAHMTCFMGFDWLRDMAQLTVTSQLMDFTLLLTTSDESRDAKV